MLFINRVVEGLCNDEGLEIEYLIPDGVSSLRVRVDLKGKTLTSSMTIGAPEDRKTAKARVNWLLKQLAKTREDGIHIKAAYAGRRDDVQAALAKVREDPAALGKEDAKVCPHAVRGEADQRTWDEEWKAPRPWCRRSRRTCRSSIPRSDSTCGRGCPARQGSQPSRRRRKWTMEGSTRQRLRNPEGPAPKILEWASTSLILVALGTAPLEATPGISEEWRQAIRWLELGILGIFTAEYGLRLWIAERPWKYALSFYGLIDLAAILPFYLTWGTETTALRAIRLLRLIRLWKHRGYTRAWIRLARALRESREEATIFLVASALTLYIAAIGIHQFEAEAQPEHFGTLGQSLWWALGLLVDVDYGEIWPVTFGGRRSRRSSRSSVSRSSRCRPAWWQAR